MRRVSGGFAANLLPLTGAPQQGLSGHLISIFRYGLFSTVVCLLVVVACGTLGMALIQGRLTASWLKRSLPWFIALAAVSFLMSLASYGLWAASPTLQMVQFPWRLMGLFTLIYAGAFGLAVESVGLFLRFWPPSNSAEDEPIDPRPRKGFSRLVSSVFSRKVLHMGGFLTAALLVCLIGWNMKYAYVLGGRYHSFYQPGNLSAARAENRWQATAYDRAVLILNDPYSNKLGEVAEYLPLLPNTNVVVPRPSPGEPSVTVASGQADIKVEQWKGEYRRFMATVNQASELHIRTYNYPAWHGYINGKATPIQTTSDGLIGLTLAPGSYMVELRYQATPAMKLGCLLSGLSLICLGILYLASRTKSLKAKRLKRQTFLQ